MPYIQVEAAKLTKEQKERLVAEITRVSSEIMEMRKEAFYVLIKENDSDNWGIAGKTLTQIINEKK
jgi:4-oxalocrotonate tautomerase